MARKRHLGGTLPGLVTVKVGAGITTARTGVPPPLLRLTVALHRGRGDDLPELTTSDFLNVECLGPAEGPVFRLKYNFQFMTGTETP